jgi:AcrR family transcriptional regulator
MTLGHENWEDTGMADRRVTILEAATRMIAQAGVRGLRVERIAEAAGVSTALIYYHFTDRAGLLRETLAFIADRADRYTAPDPDSSDARSVLEQVLLRELQDTEDVRENSTAWGELRSTAIFEDYLRDQLRESTRQWITDITELAAKALAEQSLAPDAGPPPSVPSPSAADPAAIAERLTALVEGLSERWLSGSIPLARAQHMLRDAIRIELSAAR